MMLYKLVKRIDNITDANCDAIIFFSEEILNQKIINQNIFKNSIVFQGQNRIAIIELLIEDCIKKEMFEYASYWRDFKEKILEEEVKNKSNVD